VMSRVVTDIILSNEVFGCSFYPSRAFALANVFTQCALLDLDTFGGVFTWHTYTTDIITLTSSTSTSSHLNIIINITSNQIPHTYI